MYVSDVGKTRTITRRDGFRTEICSLLRLCLVTSDYFDMLDVDFTGKAAVRNAVNLTAKRLNETSCLCCADQST